MTATAEAETAPGPLWRQIANDLAADIAAGRFGPGAALPTALQLAERYRVHRHTVRQAFHALAERGLVSVEQGRGTFVTGGRTPYRLGRQVSFRANMTAAGKSTAGAVVTATVQPAPPEIAERLGLAAGAPIWLIRTVSMADDVAISTTLHHLSAARFPDFAAQLTAAGGSVTAALKAAGVPSYRRLSTRLVARAATEVEIDLVGVAPGTAMLHSSGLDGLDDGTPIHLAETAFPGDRVEVVVDAGDA
jgi:GntR family phosphonate transport system transcriptional regulator